MKIKLNTVGADPEFFIRRIKDNVYMPSDIITYGTKDNPETTDKDGFLIHKDNLTVEGNIPPANNKEEFIANMQFLKGIINTIAKTRGCELVCEDQVRFLPRFLKIPDAQSFGCSGYYKAWDFGREEISTPDLTTDIRVAGMHLHLGYEILNTDYSKHNLDKAIARAYDLFVVLLSDKINYSSYRRKYYGEYGSYRVKNYGVECRSLGGYFARDKYLNIVYDQVIKMFDWLNTDNNINKILNINSRYNVDDSYLNFVKKELKIEETIEYKVDCSV